jgi:hypothetical protein
LDGGAKTFHNLRRARAIWLAFDISRPAESRSASKIFTYPTRGASAAYKVCDASKEIASSVVFMMSFLYDAPSDYLIRY